MFIVEVDVCEVIFFDVLFDLYENFGVDCLWIGIVVKEVFCYCCK